MKIYFFRNVDCEYCRIFRYAGKTDRLRDVLSRKKAIMKIFGHNSLLYRQTRISLMQITTSNATFAS
jgi:hypothetical protein